MQAPKITVITPTGDRPLAFALCQKWMAAQTRQPDQWIVVDDGKVPLTQTVPMQYVRREPTAKDPKFTLALNLKKALPLVTGDRVIIFEDDDYYAPEYIETMSRMLMTRVLTGIMNAKYYYLPTGGYYQNHNDKHASFSQTAFRSAILPAIKEILDECQTPFIDIQIWAKFGGQGKLFADTDRPLFVSMKGLPGRAGIGGGHNVNLYRGKNDSSDRSILKAWCPKNYQTYIDVLNNEKSYCKKVLCDIIIPTYENEDFTVNCFESIKRCTEPGTYRIIWVDNGSKNTAKAEQALIGVDHIAVRLSKNIGFVGAVNRGLSISNSDYVCLLNNDTIVSTSWLEKLIAALKQNQKLGIVGALTAPLPILARELWPAGITNTLQLKKDYDSHHNIRYIEDCQLHRAYFPEYVNLEDFNRKIEVQFPGHLADTTFIAFLCAVIKREVINKVGLLDTNFEMGMYDDNDYDLSVKKAGWETKLLYDTCIMHFGHQTFRTLYATEHFDDNALRLRNHIYLKKKWGLKK